MITAKSLVMNVKGLWIVGAVGKSLIHSHTIKCISTGAEMKVAKKVASSSKSLSGNRSVVMAHT